jgi:ABC-type transport system involved in multi-copper enzyme maturation permease subunit
VRVISAFANPLLIKQLREEMRSRKIFFIVPVYIALLSIVPLIAISSNSGASFNPMSLAANSKITMYSFVIAISILLGLVSIVFGASSFTTEREKATYELLELTPLSYIELVLGKFFHGFVLILLILLASLPVLSALFFMGGLAYTDLFLSLFYLIVFFAVILLATICISIVSSRTILSIILSLALGFVIALAIGIMSANVIREPRWLGFAVFSPWLVIWQQIYSPTAVKLMTVNIPIWPLYLGIYLLIGTLFICWGRNALDSRKLERNPWVRIIALLLINGYLLVGVLCQRAVGPITKSSMEDLFDLILLVLLFTLPCFAMGTMTDKDRSRFFRRPLIESLNFKQLFLNSPSTGILFLIVLILTAIATITLASGIPFKVVSEFAFTPLIWIIPWFFIFIAMRLSGFNARGLFIAYILGTILYVIIAAFDRTPSSSPTEFLLGQTRILIPVVVSLIFFVIARLRSGRKVEALA